MSYTSKDKVLARGLVPRNLPTNITDADWAEWISDASKEIDGEVGDDFPVLGSGWKFEAWPDTPHTISLCAVWLTASNGLEALGIENRDPKRPSGAERYRMLAEKKLKLIREKRIPVHDTDSGNELDTNTATPITVAERSSVMLPDGYSLDYF